MSVSLPSIASFHQGAHSVAVVGIGYVGLPLAVAFARHFNVIGFDLNAARVEELSAGTDRTGEVDSEALQASTARFTSDPAALREAGVIIVAVPTPIDEHRNPDLSPVEGASRTVGRHLSRGAVVHHQNPLCADPAQHSGIVPAHRKGIRAGVVKGADTQPCRFALAGALQGKFLRRFVIAEEPERPVRGKGSAGTAKRAQVGKILRRQHRLYLSL